MSSKKVERKDEAPTAATTTSSPSAVEGSATTAKEYTQQQQAAANRALDETKDNIRKATDEARSQIPHYTQSVNDYQEQTIQAAREIADNYIESQKEIINSLQSIWIPYIENTYGYGMNWISPRSMSEVYARIVSSFADNMITATRLANNMVFANMHAFKTSMQQAKDSAKELSRIGVNVTKIFEQTLRDNTTRSL